MYDYVWFVAGDMPVSDDWGVPQDSFLDDALRWIVLQELKINNVLESQSQWSVSSWACWCATYRLVLLDSRHCSLMVKLMFPMAIFLDNNLGQDSYTAFLSAFNWVPDHYTFTDHLDVNDLNVTHSCQLFSQAHPGMPQNCHGSGGLGTPNPYLLTSVGTKEVVGLVIRYSSWYTWAH